MHALFRIPSAGGDLGLEVFDVVGRRVRTIGAARVPAGVGSAEWDGRDEMGRLVGSGIYFIRLVVEGRPLARQRIVVIR